MIPDRRSEIEEAIRNNENGKHIYKLKLDLAVLIG